jgi:signal recognition particle GTPase
MNQLLLNTVRNTSRISIASVRSGPSCYLLNSRKVGMSSNNLAQSFHQLFPELETNSSTKEAVFNEIYSKEEFLSVYSKEQRHYLFENFYWLVYQHIKDQYNKHKNNNSSSGAFIVGLSAPQGSGKTTVTELLKKFFAYEQINFLNLSLDDFYLTGQEQMSLNLHHPENNLFKYRGNGNSSIWYSYSSIIFIFLFSE